MQIKVFVNGESTALEARTVAQALVELGYGGAVVATALNEQFLALQDREQQEIKNGDRLEVLAPMQGG